MINSSALKLAKTKWNKSHVIVVFSMHITVNKLMFTICKDAYNN